jgi:Holliday junction resolvase-like predicted endonuclease
MTNYATGHIAELQAVKFIENRGYTIVATNWKTKNCEIDIIAQKAKRIHFIEVKYREKELQGRGFDYITPRKLKQMTYAAEVWVQESDWQSNYCLGAIELTGPDFLVAEFLPMLD